MTDENPGATPFKHDFDPRHGELIHLSPLVRRLTANNPGPFTFTGTNTYVVGRDHVAVIDPGPDDPAHIAALVSALQGETITTILVTHTHRDHSPGARLLQQTTGAAIIGCGPYAPARDLALGEINALDAANDLEHRPDRVLHDGDMFQGEGFQLLSIYTPGHTMNHLAFALPEENALFSGDHVMGWSTTIVAPPDGAMQPYMASLEKLLTREDKVYWPGHGGGIDEPQHYVRALIAHRRAREKAIRDRLAAGDTKIETIVANVYQGLDPRLLGAAALSVFAQIEDLATRNEVIADGPLTLTASYRLR